MVNFKIKIANMVLDINAFNETTKKYCEDFLNDEEQIERLMGLCINIVNTYSEKEFISRRARSPQRSQEHSCG